MRTFFIILLAIVLYPSVLTFAQSDSTALEQRVKLLEDYNERVLEQQFQAQSNQLSQRIDVELEKAKLELSTEVATFKIIGYVVGAVITLGIGYLFFQVVWGFKKRIERVMRQNLETHLRENSSYLLELITSQKIENTIRKSKAIFVIAGSQPDLDRTVSLLKAMKFEKIDGGVYRYYETLPSADIYIFSSRDQSLPGELINEFMEKGQDEDCYIYYGANRLIVDTGARYAEQVNYANSRFTLYHQALTTLAFRDAIR